MIKFKWFGIGSSDKTTSTLSPEAAAQGAQAATAQAQENPDGKRVLIVDDDPVFLSATSMKLRSAGFQVRTARESAEAIAALGEQSADAVLMDITFQPDVCNGGMGSWDGFQIMTWLRGMPTAKGARFIMVSNSDSPSDRQRAKQAGAVAYFQKPVDHGQLIAAVNAEN
jgi:two-component system, sensor histidine kinase ChiS